MDDFYYEKIHHSQFIPAMIEILDNQQIQKHFSQQPFVPAHWHRSIEMSYIKNAKVLLKIGQKEYNIENDFTFINSGQVHSLVAQSLSEESQAMIVIISYDFIKQYCPQIDDISFDLLLHKDHSQLQALYEKLKELYLHQNAYSYLLITACLLEIMHVLLTDYQTIQKKTTKFKKQEK